jgi:hypothetical protein
MIFRGMEADQPHRPLGILERHRGLRIDLARPIPLRSRVRNAVLQQYACDPLCRQPITDLGALKIDGQDVIAPTWKHDDCNTGIPSLGRIDRYRRSRDVRNREPRPARNRRLCRFRRFGVGRRAKLRVRRNIGPYRHLRVAWRRLPTGLLGEQSGTREHKAGSNEQRLDHNPQHICPCRAPANLQRAFFRGPAPSRNGTTYANMGFGALAGRL